MVQFNLGNAKRSTVMYGVAAAVSIVATTWIRIRPLSLLFLSVLAVWIFKTQCNLRIVPPPDLERKISDITDSLRTWRTNNPTMFCIVASGCLSILAILGHLISGSTAILVGLVLAALISTKYNFKTVKIEHKDFTWAEKLNFDPDVDEEFIPEVNESNLFVLERASDLAILSSHINDTGVDDKNDEIPPELLIPEAIPEIEEHSSDGEEADLEALSGINKNLKKSKTSDMEFRKGHFKRDSSLSTTSSSSEESLSRGLKFPDHTAVDSSIAQRQLPSTSLPHNQEASDIVALAVRTQTQTLLSNSTKLLPSLVSVLIPWRRNSDKELNNPTAVFSSGERKLDKPPVATIIDYSDESDFEIVDNDDLI